MEIPKKLFMKRQNVLIFVKNDKTSFRILPHIRKTEYKTQMNT